LIQNLVPYHHARFEAFCSQEGIDGVLLQVTDRDAFKVLEFKSDHAYYRLRTLFAGVGPGEIRLSQIRQRLFECIDEEKPDVLCVSGFGIDSGIAMLAAAVKYNLPAVIFSDSNEFDHPRHTLTEKMKHHLLAICSAAVAAGHSAADYLQKLGMPEKAIQLGYDVISPAHFQAYERRSNNIVPYFFVCARMEQKKNYFRLLEAYAEYRKCSSDPWPLKIAGDGYLRSKIEAEIQASNLEAHVELLGAVPYEKIASYYRNAGAFVHISTTEQWGLVVNEAMTAGCPLIVSSRCGCVRDLVQDGQNGFIIDPYCVDDIAEKLKQLSSQPPEELAAMGHASENIISDWGPERFCSGLNAAITFACQHPKKHGLLPRLTLKFLQFLKG